MLKQFNQHKKNTNMKEKEAKILLSLFYIKVIPFTQIQRAYIYMLS